MGTVTAEGQQSQSESGMDLSRYVKARWKAYLDQQSAAHDAIFAAWRAYAAIPAPEFASRASAVTEQIQKDALPNESVHLLVQQAFAGEAPKSLREVADRYGKL